MSLQEKIDELVRESAKKVPPKALEILKNFRLDIRAMISTESIPGKCDLFPSFEMVNHEIRSVS